MTPLFRVVAVGRGMPPPVQALVEEYQKRLTPLGGAVLVEVAEHRRTGGAGERQQALAREAERLRPALAGAPFIALDLQGRQLSSESFSQLVGQERETGRRMFQFLIGGPDGIHQELLHAAAWRLSLGPMTLPHMLTRVVLLEQLYRAMTILHRLPYHR